MAQPLLQSVDNALRILELFDEAARELSLTEISRDLGLGKSTVHRLLSTMEARKFIDQNPETGRYRLGVRLIHIGSNRLGNINVIDECRPVLERLSAVTGESSHLSFHSNGLVTFVDRAGGANPAVMSCVVGFSSPAYSSASGKIFLAYMERNALDNLLRFTTFSPRTPYTITNRLELMEALERVLSNGYAEDQQEGMEGLVSFAAPIWDGRKALVAAMGISGAASRMNARRDILVRELLAAARFASGRCGFRPGATATA